ncbi:female-specific lacrimal gland protein [Cricetulus griseus]|uniref:female-specific lacrimal gland protein n=1 Tax=Cricetulus griseus TaxID=10029 RepID=UPI00022F5F9F|nr:female-specific lacrimal gland protein [Cricetulus griseus]
MVKFLLLAFALSVSCAHHKIPEISPSEVDGKWRTLYIGADNTEKVIQGGPLRAYFRHMECSDECQTLTITFNTKEEGKCQTHTVVGRKDEDGQYKTGFSGNNDFHVVEKADGIIIFHNVNVDSSGKKTNVILVAGKGKSLSKEQKERLENIAKEFDISKENIQHLVPTAIIRDFLRQQLRTDAGTLS